MTGPWRAAPWGSSDGVAMTNETIQREATFWDRRAEEKPPEYYYDGLVTVPDEKLARIAAYAIARLGGDLAGRRILDLGCGTGGSACYLARAGARVSAIDVSEKNIALTGAWCARNKVAVDARVMPCEDLAFEPGTFDGIVGFFILHHVAIEKAASAIRRVARPGAPAVFVETFGDNALLMFFRDRVLPVFRLNKGSPDEHPLTARSFAAVEGILGKAVVYAPELIFFRLIASYVFNDARWARRFFSAIDDWIGRIIPAARSLSYYKVVVFTVPG